MEYLVVISLILSVLSFSLSVLSFSASVWMKVSERKWKKAMLDCIQQECKSSCDIALNHSNETAKTLTERMENLNNRLKNAEEKLQNAKKWLAEDSKRIEEIQGKLQDLSLDYSQAQNAANRINDFSNGLMQLFDYDPMEALRRKRESGDN